MEEIVEQPQCVFSMSIDEQTTCSRDGEFNKQGLPINPCTSYEKCAKIKSMRAMYDSSPRRR